MAHQNATIRDGLYNLISYWCLAENRYAGETFTIELKDGKKYTVREGCKPMKALQKIAEAYELEGFEDFRICHSLVHNDKRVSGTINLSIHPLDYWTMSDNNCGWSSCMSWSEDGGYKQGTVEMMNSPCVIVAYLTSSTNNYIIDKNSWNDKKWRQLFIVDPECILGIKSYPYFNKELTNLVMKWLRELAETNMGWSYFGQEDGEPIAFLGESMENPMHPEDEHKIFFEFYSNNMYKDVGACDSHPLYIGVDVHEKSNKYPKYKRTIGCLNQKVEVYEFNYSGAAQCMSCGAIDPDFEDEGCLSCEDCQDGMRCACCGASINEESAYWVGDSYVCEYCYTEHTGHCVVCDEEHFLDDMTSIHIRLPLSDEFKEKLFIDRPWMKNDADVNDVFCLLPSPMYVCYGKEDEVSEYLKHGAKVKSYILSKGSWIKHKYIDIADLDMDNDEIMWRIDTPYNFITNYTTAKATGNFDKLIDCYWHELSFINAEAIKEE